MEKAIDIGKLNKKITFQKYDDIKDSMGQEKKEWKDLFTVWADFYPVRAGEYQEAEKQKREEVTHKAKIRYKPGIDASMRIVFRGRIFWIDKVINVDEANYKLEIECTEYVERGNQNGGNRDRVPGDGGIAEGIGGHS